MIKDTNRQQANYFNSVIADFKTLKVMADRNTVVITGTAEFFRNNKRLSFISACDVYEFNEKNQLQNIPSYCLQSKGH